jgi:hypothetical protein
MPGIFEQIMQLFAPLGEVLPTGQRIGDIFEAVIEGTDKMNSRFTQSRQRVTEFSTAIGDSIPLVERLGGTQKDAALIIDQVAEATRRNVVASADEVEKLFAVQQLTGTDAKRLVETFQNIGVQFSQINNQVEGSIKYIQSVGANARDIMREVNGYVEKMNSYNFQDGVLGLTRMATQASLLKFDMTSTLSFAEKVMDPEGAIKMASAFQRLGVAAGDLTDPFQLMYKSLNDPEGLQNSIVNMTKQFTYFDEKANSFKINPQGMLMIRQLGIESGIGAQELSKMALNAADLDKKLSQISPSFNFENEQDKQYIANIAKMGAGGEYEITVKDEDGKDKRVLLQEATNEQLQELLDRQKAGQEDQTTVDIQKTQLDLLKSVVSELKATMSTFVAAAASSRELTQAINGMSGRLAFLGEIDKYKKKAGIDKVTTTSFRDKVDSKENIGKVKDLVDVFLSGDKEKMKATMKDILADTKVFAEEGLKDLSNTIKDAFKSVIETIGKGKASGGYVYGEGTSTSDSIPTMLSNGEFVVNAKSAASFGPLLEIINKNPDYDLKKGFTSEGLELKNTNDITASNITNKSITELISNLTTSTTNNETRTTKVEFGEISPLKVIFEKGPGFSDNDMAMLEYNLGKSNIVEQLTKSLSEKLKVLQVKEV